MDKKTLLKKKNLSICLLSSFFFVTSCSKDGYTKYEGDEAKQVAVILEENGCMECHAENATVPFYGHIPLVGSMIKSDIEEGEKFLLLDQLLDDLENGNQPTEVDVAKIENVALSGTMPPPAFRNMPNHWGTSLDDKEKEILINWAKNTRKAHYTSPTVAEEFASEPLQPLVHAIPTDSAKVVLGDKLFHDTRLSVDNTVSCATCHELSTGGVDRLQYSKGVDGQLGGVNAPTVYNAALNFAQFWDGRATTLEEQAAGPPLNPVEMGYHSFDEICEALKQNPEYVEFFASIYPDGITEANITNAIAEFERTLLTPSRFDQYLRGDKTALTEEEIAGYEMFKDNKCATCHVGMNVGGQSYEYFGIKSDYFDYRGTGLTDGDNGRYAVTKEERDRHKFKTPTLRNIAVTQPYMHDGTVETLEEAVKVMGTFQGGKELTDDEVAKIVTFLNTLTGEYNGETLK